jgi:hypothetical protein
MQQQVEDFSLPVNGESHRLAGHTLVLDQHLLTITTSTLLLSSYGQLCWLPRLTELWNVVYPAGTPAVSPLI